MASDSLQAARVVAITDRRHMVPAEVLASGDRGAIAAAFRAAIARAVADCPAGSVIVQVREKDLEGGDLLALARAAREVAPVIVNDRLDVALAIDAAGVHLPEAGLAIDAARQLAPRMHIGASRHVRGDGDDVEALLAAAAREGADAVQLGPIWPTPSKPGVATLGPSVLAAPRTIALVAVGGIDSVARAAEAFAAGADAVAVIRAAWAGGSLAPYVAAK